MSLVSAVIGMTQGNARASDCEFEFNNVANALQNITKKASNIGERLARFDSYIGNLDNQKSQLFGMQNALIQSSIFNQGKGNNTNLQAQSGNIQGQFRQIMQKIITAKKQKHTLKSQEKSLHEQEKVLQKKKDNLETQKKLAEGMAKKNTQFRDSAIKRMFGGR